MENCRLTEAVTGSGGRVTVSNACFVTRKSSVYAGLRGAVTKLQKLQVFYKLIGRHICIKEV